MSKLRKQKRNEHALKHCEYFQNSGKILRLDLSGKRTFRKLLIVQTRQKRDKENITAIADN